MGVQIIGVSFGEPEVLRSWADEENFEFELWRDDDRTLALHYGAIETASSFWPDRITVMLDGDGNHILTYEVDIFGIGSHPADVLEDCETLFGTD